MYSSPTNQLPGIAYSSPCSDTHDPEAYTDKLRAEIRQHAHQRILIIHVKAEAVFGLGKRTYSHTTSNLRTGVEHARAQVDRGNDEWDAAHSDAAAGFYDNRRIEIGREIMAENTITPIKLAVLKSKSHQKFTEADILELLSLTNNPDQFWNRFDQLWTPSKYEFSNILDDTYVGTASNITTLMPRDLNRTVDRGLERKIRPLYAQLLEASMLGKIEPDEIAKTYQVAIKQHFAKAEQLIKRRIEDLTQYKILIDKLTAFHTDEQKALLKEISTIQNKLARYVYPGVPSVFEPEIPNLFDETIDDDSDAMLLLKSKFHHTVSEIKSSFTSTLNRMKCYLLFTQEESAGSELPDFTMLSGTYVKEIDKRMPLSPTKRLENRFEILRPCDVKQKRKSNAADLTPVKKQLVADDEPTENTVPTTDYAATQ